MATPTPQWTPPAEHAAYYATPSPADQLSALPQLLGLVPADPTYGRAALPRYPAEEVLRSEFKHKDGKVAMGEGGRDWVAYQIWEAKEGTPKRDADLLFIHGINDFGGKFSEHARHFLDEGYRVIVPDLPSHGRSTGIHVHLPDLDLLADAVFAVLSDVVKNEATGSAPVQKRKIFVAGQSLGGYVAALTCLKYGSPTDTDLPVSTSFRPEISGGLFLCPMLAISPETRPHWMIEKVARAIASVAGPLPLAAANKGKNSEDPLVEQQFLSDPQTYHGKLRVATGLAILKGLTELDVLMSHLKVPFSAFHGSGDRVTSYHGSEKLLREAGSTDKELKLYEDYQHILLRKGKDEADDVRRQAVLRDMLDWLSRH